MVNAGTCFNNEVLYYFMPTEDLPVVPNDDVVTACSKYFQTILEIVYDCYERFGPIIDSQQRYTADYFEALRKTIDDAEEELGFPRGWTDVGDPNAIAYRWQTLRDQAEVCEINHLFEKLLGRVTRTPERLPPYQPISPGR